MVQQQSDLPAPRVATEQKTMTAIVQDRYGEAGDVLRRERIDRPEIGDDEVLLRIHATAVDRGVWHLMTGLAYPIRLAGFGVRAPKTRVRGREVAGRVEAVGKDVTGLRPGADVFGFGEGGFAEYAVAKQDKVVPMPTNLDFVQAAAATVSATTALQAVRDSGKVTSGQKVLVIGASGGVGTYAVQIAKAFGAEVTGVCTTSKVDLVSSIGADHVIDYVKYDIGKAHQRYDVIIDIGGNRSLRQLRRVLTKRGTLVIVGGEAGGKWTGGMGRTLRALMLSPFGRQRLTGLLASENRKDLIAITALLESAEVVPAIDRTFPLDETPAAIQYLQDGHARGKVVVTV